MRIPSNVVATLLLSLGCTAYVNKTEDALFLSGRIVDADRNPLNHCHVGVETDGRVARWQAVGSDLRAVFVVSRLIDQHRIIIQCGGYSDRVIAVRTRPRAGWIVENQVVGINETVQLGEFTMEPAQA